MGPFIFGFFWFVLFVILLVCELGFAFIYLFMAVVILKLPITIEIHHHIVKTIVCYNFILDGNLTKSRHPWIELCDGLNEALCQICMHPTNLPATDTLGLMVTLLLTLVKKKYIRKI